MSSIDNQKDYWDSVASQKSFSHPFDNRRFSSLISKDQRILDYGCGYGRICEELWKKGYRSVLGVDTSYEMITQGKKQYPHLCFQVLPNANMPFKTNSFDSVILFAVLTCIPTNKGQELLIQEIHQVIRPGGVLYVSDYWLQDDDRNRERYRKWKDRYGTYGIFELSEGAVCRHHDRKWIEKLFSSFEMIEFVDIDVFTMNGNKAKAFQYYGRKRSDL